MTVNLASNDRFMIIPVQGDEYHLYNAGLGTVGLMDKNDKEGMDADPDYYPILKETTHHCMHHDGSELILGAGDGVVIKVYIRHNGIPTVISRGRNK